MVWNWLAGVVVAVVVAVAVAVVQSEARCALLAVLWTPVSPFVAEVLAGLAG